MSPNGSDRRSTTSRLALTSSGLLPALLASACWLLPTTAVGARPTGTAPPCVPLAVDDSYTVVAGDLLVGQVLTNDTTCGAGAGLHVPPQHAAPAGFTLHVSGAFLYETAIGFVGPDTFVYVLDPVEGVFGTATLNVVAPPSPTTTSTTTATTTTTTSTLSTTTTVASAEPSTTASPSAEPSPTDPATTTPTTTPTAATPTSPPPPATGSGSQLPATR